MSRAYEAARAREPDWRTPPPKSLRNHLAFSCRGREERQRCLESRNQGSEPTHNEGSGSDENAVRQELRRGLVSEVRQGRRRRQGENARAHLPMGAPRPLLMHSESEWKGSHASPSDMPVLATTSHRRAPSQWSGIECRSRARRRRTSSGCGKITAGDDEASQGLAAKSERREREVEGRDALPLRVFSTQTSLVIEQWTSSSTTHWSSTSSVVMWCPVAQKTLWTGACEWNEMPPASETWTCARASVTTLAGVASVRCVRMASWFDCGRAEGEGCQDSARGRRRKSEAGAGRTRVPETQKRPASLPAIWATRSSSSRVSSSSCGRRTRRSAAALAEASAARPALRGRRGRRTSYTLSPSVPSCMIWSISWLGTVIVSLQGGSTGSA